MVEVVGSTTVEFENAAQGDKKLKVYLVHEHYFDRDKGKWFMIETTGPFPMDGSFIDKDYQVGDVVIAYWDLQRNMYAPICCQESDSMWCGYVCECAKREVEGDSSSKCCAYRGTVKRLDDVSNICDPGYITKGAWIVADCDVPEESEGWVRPTGEEMTLTWTSENTGITLTETLEIYEWCCWGSVDCPSTNSTMTARFSHSGAGFEECHESMAVIGEVTMHYVTKEKIRNLSPRSDNEIIFAVFSAYDGWWQGEFSVDVVQDVRGYGVSYLIKGEGGEPTTDWDDPYIGYVVLDPLTGEIKQMFKEEQSAPGDSIDLNEVIITDYHPSDCWNMSVDAKEPLDPETITRWYRVQASCSGGDITHCVMQHLYPPGHPIYRGHERNNSLDLADATYRPPTDGTDDMAQYMYAAVDAENVPSMNEICHFNSVGTFDLIFGQSHTQNRGEWYASIGKASWFDTDGKYTIGGVPNFQKRETFDDDGDEEAFAKEFNKDGIFGGQQFGIHTFVGCKNDFFSQINPDGIPCGLS